MHQCAPPARCGRHGVQRRLYFTVVGIWDLSANPDLIGQVLGTLTVSRAAQAGPDAMATISPARFSAP
ncbi:MAG: hypothetical protein N2037_07825 [Acidimicrobiales bacterium]|nr:hypothetical protein [Acidimicrobiales bacterium]